MIVMVHHRWTIQKILQVTIEYLGRIIAVNICCEYFHLIFNRSILSKVLITTLLYIAAKYSFWTGAIPDNYKCSESTDYEESEVGTVAYLSSDDGGTSSGKSTKTGGGDSSSSPSSQNGSSEDSDSFTSSDDEPLSKYKAQDS